MGGRLARARCTSLRAAEEGRKTSAASHMETAMGSKEARMRINRGEPATRKLAEAPLRTAQGRERGYNTNPHGAHRSSSIPKQSTCPRFPVSGLPVRPSQRDSTTCHTALQPVHGGQAQDRRPTIWGGGSQVTTKLRSGLATASPVVHPTAQFQLARELIYGEEELEMGEGPLPLPT